MRLRLLVFAAFFSTINVEFAHSIASGLEAKDTKSANETTGVTVYHEDDPKSWARVNKIRAVDFPQASLKQGLTGKVDAEVLIDILGSVKSIRSLKSTPQNSEFEAAVRTTLETATFNVPRSLRCVPIESVGELQFEFVIVDGVGRVHLLHREASMAAHNALLAPRIINRDEVAVIARSGYPVNARRVGAQASVSMMLEVDPQTGAVISALATNVVTLKGLERLFGKVATDAAKSLRYESVGGMVAPITTCFTLDYRLVGVGRV